MKITTLLLLLSVLFSACNNSSQIEKKKLEFNNGKGAWGSCYDPGKKRLIYEPETYYGTTTRVVYFQYARLYDSAFFMQISGGYQGAYSLHLIQYADEHPWLELVNVQAVSEDGVEIGQRTYWTYHPEKDTSGRMVQVWPPPKDTKKI